MKRIAFYSREFRLCEWPELKPFEFEDSQAFADRSHKAITSAMENGIAFADQEGVKQFIFKTTNEIRGTMLIWQPKDGDNWPAPEWTEIEEHYYLGSVHKVAVLRSESVKESNNEDYLKIPSGTAIKRAKAKLEKAGRPEDFPWPAKGESVEKKEKPEFQDIVKFLLGESSFYGIWFGEKHPAEPGQFWWRNHLRVYIDKLTAPESSPAPSEVFAIINDRGMIVGCFESEIDAEKYRGHSNCNIQKLSVYPSTSPAPLESQEELWKEAWDYAIGKGNEDSTLEDYFNFIKQGPFTLTRRTKVSCDSCDHKSCGYPNSDCRDSWKLENNS